MLIHAGANAQITNRNGRYETPLICDAIILTFFVTNVAWNDHYIHSINL